MNAHELVFHGLSEAVAGAPSDDRHAALLKAIRAVDGLGDAFLSTIRGGIRLLQRKVVTDTGELVHDDHRTWLAGELAREGDRPDSVLARLRPLGLRLTEVAVETLYIAVDRGGRQDNVVQLQIERLDEVIDRRLFSTYSDDWRLPPEDLRDLLDAAEGGEQLASC